MNVNVSLTTVVIYIDIIWVGASKIISPLLKSLVTGEIKWDLLLGWKSSIENYKGVSNILVLKKEISVYSSNFINALSYSLVRMAVSGTQTSQNKEYHSSNY